MIMIEDPRGPIDYDECGGGPTVVMVPGSCSTGAAWRPIIAQWGGRFRCVTTSLCGYGGTAERRTPRDPSIAHEAEVLEAVIRRAGGPVHVVAHSFGGLVAIAVALRRRVPVASIVIAEAPAAELLRTMGEHAHYQAFRDMTDAYFDDFCDGNTEAIATMIDFYGGAGTFASWPERVRAYAVDTTSVNIRDWASAYGFPLSPALLAPITVPVLVLWGQKSHPAAKRANELLGRCFRTGTRAVIDGAAHFMISTHAPEVARLVAAHIDRAEAPRVAERETALAVA
jgi:pimeloyl-ACP methyl ester carboxylesterase